MKIAFFLLVHFFIYSAAAAESSLITGSIGEKRVALVVGNGTYEHIDDQLMNPVNDARAMADYLRALDVEVIEAVDLDYRGMLAVLRNFNRALQDADAGLFYYAGHGMEYQGQNYLFPTDAILETEGDIGLGLIDMDQVLQVMETAVPTRLVFLDACRNNPLARSFRNTLSAGRSAAVGRGLGPIDAAAGTFIAYATAPGEIAADGKGENSPFTKAMLQHLGEPGLEISQLMHKVRSSVIEATNEKQIPWESSSLRGPFILNLEVTVNPIPLAEAATAGGESERAEIVFWESIKDSDRIPPFEAYLERFGADALFSPLASDRIKELQVDSIKTAEAPPGFDKQRVQRALAALGYDVGAADGIFGPQTRRAIKAWQENTGEAVTSHLSVEQASVVLAKAAALTPSSQPSSNAGRLLDKRRQAGDALKRKLTRYQNSCDNGDTDGCAKLGRYYEKSSGPNQDIEKAAELYQRTCNEGFVSSCGKLGYLYSKGQGVELDYAKALELHQRACADNYTWSCGKMGEFYQNGRAVKQDYAKAKMLYEQVCTEDYAWGCGKLGILYQEGKGVDQNYAKAVDYHRQACTDDHAWSCRRLGDLHKNGDGVDQDREKALMLYQKACSGDDANGCTKFDQLQNK